MTGGGVAPAYDCHRTSCNALTSCLLMDSSLILCNAHHGLQSLDLSEILSCVHLQLHEAHYLPRWQSQKRRCNKDVCDAMCWSCVILKLIAFAKGLLVDLLSYSC